MVGRGWMRRVSGTRPAASWKPLLVSGDGWAAAADALHWRDRRQADLLRAVLGNGWAGREEHGAQWAARVRELEGRENREARAGLVALFDALAEAVPHYLAREANADGRPLLVSQDNTVAAVNLLSAATLLLEASAVPTLGRVLDRAQSEPWTLESGRVRTACIRALVRVGTAEAAEVLRTAAELAPTKAQRAQVLTGLDAVTRRDAPAPSEIAESHVSAHGLGEDGRRVIRVRHRVFELSLLPDGRVDVLDRSRDATPDEAAERVLAAEVRAIRAAYRQEAARIEALMATGRSWTYARWRRLYLDNPITRAVAARTVWRMDLPDGRTVDVLPSETGGVSASLAAGKAGLPEVEDLAEVADAVDAVAEPADLPTPSTVRLWHPREVAPRTLAAWREIRAARALVQPFAQIDRDFTRVEPDPDAVELNQYAGFPVDAGLFEAAVARLGWHTRRVRAGPRTDAVRIASRDFPDDELTVAITCPEREGTVVPGVGWFHRTQDRARTPLPLGLVPPRVHSEALRDLAVLARGASPPAQDAQSDAHEDAGDHVCDDVCDDAHKGIGP